MTVLQGATPQWRWCFWAAGAGFALRLLIAQMPPVSRSSTNRWWRHGKYPFHPQKHLPQSLPETRLLDEIWNTERKAAVHLGGLPIPPPASRGRRCIASSLRCRRCGPIPHCREWRWPPPAPGPGQRAREIGQQPASVPEPTIRKGWAA